MPEIKCIAIKDFKSLFSIGDNVTIVPVLYEKDTLLVNKIYGLFKKSDGSLFKYFEKSDLQLKITDQYDIKLVYDELYAPKGSYKDSYIRTEDGREYPGSLINDYNIYFKKIIK